MYKSEFHSLPCLVPPELKQLIRKKRLHKEYKITLWCVKYLYFTELVNVWVTVSLAATLIMFIIMLEGMCELFACLFSSVFTLPSLPVAAFTYEITPQWLCLYSHELNCWGLLGTWMSLRNVGRITLCWGFHIFVDPLLRLFNASLFCESFPDSLKQSNIIPIHKLG